MPMHSLPRSPIVRAEPPFTVWTRPMGVTPTASTRYKVARRASRGTSEAACAAARSARHRLRARVRVVRDRLQRQEWDASRAWPGRWPVEWSDDQCALPRRRESTRASPRAPPVEESRSCLPHLSTAGNSHTKDRQSRRLRRVQYDTTVRRSECSLPMTVPARRVSFQHRPAGDQTRFARPKSLTG